MKTTPKRTKAWTLTGSLLLAGCLLGVAAASGTLDAMVNGSAETSVGTNGGIDPSALAQAQAALDLSEQAQGELEAALGSIEDLEASAQALVNAPNADVRSSAMATLDRAHGLEAEIRQGVDAMETANTDLETAIASGSNAQLETALKAVSDVNGQTESGIQAELSKGGVDMSMSSTSSSSDLVGSVQDELDGATRAKVDAMVSAARIVDADLDTTLAVLNEAQTDLNMAHEATTSADVSADREGNVEGNINTEGDLTVEP